MPFYTTSIIPFFHLVMMMGEWKLPQKTRAAVLHGLIKAPLFRGVLSLQSISSSGRSAGWYKRERCQDRPACMHKRTHQRLSAIRLVSALIQWNWGTRWKWKDGWRGELEERLVEFAVQCSLSFPLDLSPGNFSVVEEIAHMQRFIQVSWPPRPPFHFTPWFHVALLFSVLYIFYSPSIPHSNQTLPLLGNHTKLSLIHALRAFLSAQGDLVLIINCLLSQSFPPPTHSQ